MRVVILALLALATGVVAETKPAPLMIELVSDRAAIEPGAKFTVGLFLRHAPEHHSYWKFPGIVGVPTRMEWNLPKGFAAGPIEWPIPRRVDMLGWKAHGYKTDQLLLVELTAPGDLAVETRVRLAGKASWMCCSPKGCTPGFTELELTLPVEKAGRWEKAWREKFAAARAALPITAPGWKAAAQRRGERFILELTRPEGAKALKADDLYFYNDNGLVNSHEKQERQATASGHVFHLTRFEFADENATRLQGVVVGPPGWLGEGTTSVGLLVDAPLERPR